MSRLGRHRLPNYMANPPWYILRQLGIGWDEWNAPELLTAMAYRQAARIERMDWVEVELDSEAVWSTTSTRRVGDLYVGTASFISGVACDPEDDGALRSLLEPLRLSDRERRLGRPVGE